MPKVLDILAGFAANITSTELIILSGLVAVMVAGLVVPRMLSMRSRRDFTDRDDEYQRLQNM